MLSKRGDAATQILKASMVLREITTSTLFFLVNTVTIKTWTLVRLSLLVPKILNGSTGRFHCSINMRTTIVGLQTHAPLQFD